MHNNWLPCSLLTTYSQYFIIALLKCAAKWALKEVKVWRWHNEGIFTCDKYRVMKLFVFVFNCTQYHFSWKIFHIENNSYIMCAQSTPAEQARTICILHLVEVDMLLVVLWTIFVCKEIIWMWDFNWSHCFMIMIYIYKSNNC